MVVFFNHSCDGPGQFTSDSSPSARFRHVQRWALRHLYLGLCMVWQRKKWDEHLDYDSKNRWFFSIEKHEHQSIYGGGSANESWTPPFKPQIFFPPVNVAMARLTSTVSGTEHLSPSDAAMRCEGPGHDKTSIWKMGEFSKVGDVWGITSYSEFTKLIELSKEMGEMGPVFFFPTLGHRPWSIDLGATSRRTSLWPCRLPGSVDSDLWIPPPGGNFLWKMLMTWKWQIHKRSWFHHEKNIMNSVTLNHFSVNQMVNHGESRHFQGCHCSARSPPAQNAAAPCSGGDEPCL